MFKSIKNLVDRIIAQLKPVHVYQHIIGIREYTFTKDELLTIAQTAYLHKKLIKNKLSVLNAFTYKGTQEDFIRVKGKIEALEELLIYYSARERDEQAPVPEITPLS